MIVKITKTEYSIEYIVYSEEDEMWVISAGCKTVFRSASRPVEENQEKIQKLQDKR